MVGQELGLGLADVGLRSARDGEGAPKGERERQN